MAKIDGEPVVQDTICSNGESGYSDISDGLWAQSLIERFGSNKLFFQLSFDGVEVFSKYYFLCLYYKSMTALLQIFWIRGNVYGSLPQYSTRVQISP